MGELSRYAVVRRACREFRSVPRVTSLETTASTSSSPFDPLRFHVARANDTDLSGDAFGADVVLADGDPDDVDAPDDVDVSA